MSPEKKKEKPEVMESIDLELQPMANTDATVQYGNRPIPSVVLSNFLATTRETTNIWSMKIIRLLETRLRNNYVRGEPFVLNQNDMELLGLTKQRLTSHMKEAGEALLTAYVYSWEEVDGMPNSYDWVGCNFFNKVKISKAHGEIHLWLNPSLEDELINRKKNFLKYPLENIIGLSSAYALKLHDTLLALYRKFDCPEALLIDIKELANELEYGNTDEKFKPNVFVSNIIKRSVAYINENTALYVRYVPVRAGRSTAYIRFFIEDFETLEKKKVQLEQLDKMPAELKAKLEFESRAALDGQNEYRVYLQPTQKLKKKSE